MAPLVRDRLAEELVAAVVSLGIMALTYGVMFPDARRQLVADTRDAFARRLEAATWPTTWPRSPRALFARQIRARLLESEGIATEVAA